MKVGPDRPGFLVHAPLVSVDNAINPDLSVEYIEGSPVLPNNNGPCKI